MTGIELIAQERREQIEKHGFTINDDTKYHFNELLLMARTLLLGNNDAEKDDLEDLLIYHYGFKREFIDKVNSKLHIEKLSIAGALIAAEIDRIQNQ